MHLRNGGMDQGYKERMEQKANLKVSNSFGSSMLLTCTSNQFKSGNVKQSQASSDMNPNSVPLSSNFTQQYLSQQHQQWFQSIGEMLGIKNFASVSDQESVSAIMTSIRQLQSNVDSQRNANFTISKQNLELIESNKSMEGTILSLRKWSSERNGDMEKMLNTISQCDHDMEIHEQDSINKRNELEKQIQGLKTEVFKCKEVEVSMREEMERMKNVSGDLEISKGKIDELTKDIKNLEFKYSNLKKISRERELKCEKLSSQLTSTRSKYANKLRNAGIETGKTIDSLLVELKLVKGINEKLLDNSIPTQEEVNGIQTRAFNELYDYFAKETPQHYVQKVYENRYLSLLLALKQTKDSNEIHHTTIESLLKFICSNFEKLPTLTNENVVYFRTLVNEFHKRKMLKNADIDFLKKILNTYDQMMETATEEFVSP